MDDVYENINDYNPIRKRKKLIVFDDMIADIMTNKRFFITQSYFSVPKDVRLNSTHYLIMKINNKRELQNIAINHSAGIITILRKFIENVQKNHIIFWQ